MPDFGFLTYIKAEDWLLIIMLVVFVLSAVILLFVYLQMWAYAALVSQTLNVVKGKKVSFKEGKEMGEKFFWRVLGFRVLLGLMIIPAIILLAVPPLLFFVAGVEMLAIVFLVISTVIFIFGVFAYAVVSGIVSEFGLREMIENDFGIIDSMKRGMRMFRGNLGSSILIFLVNTALGFAIAIPFVFVSLVLFLMGFVFFAINPWLIVIPILIFVTFLVVAGGIWNVFIFSYWSLAYNQLKRGGRTNSVTSTTA